MTWEIYEKPRSIINYFLSRNIKQAQYIGEAKNNRDLRWRP